MGGGGKKNEMKKKKSYVVFSSAGMLPPLDAPCATFPCWKIYLFIYLFSGLGGVGFLYIYFFLWPTVTIFKDIVLHRTVACFFIHSIRILRGRRTRN